MVYYEIRCPCGKTHSVNGVEYDRCGNLLGALEEGATSYFRCPTCGMVLADDSGEVLELTVLGKTKINFTKTLRRVVDNE